MECLQFGHIGFALIAEAAFLEGDVGEFFAVGPEDFSLNERLADGGIALIGIKVGEFELAHGPDAGFERGDAEKTPIGVRDGLDESAFLVGGRGELGVDAVNVLLVDDGVIGGQEDGATGKTRFDGVQRGGSFASGAGWTGAALGVGTVGVQLSVGDGLGSGRRVGRRFGGGTVGALGGAALGTVRHSFDIPLVKQKARREMRISDELFVD